MFESAHRALGDILGRDGGHCLYDSRVGLEKESLRVDSDGFIARTPHPRALGSALTHPWITTDYSEALLEFVTPPSTSLGDTHRFLRDIHVFVYSKLEAERLWAASMPCMIGEDAAIPLAEYGSSNAGRMKNIYRRGLGYRYGRTMQTISGVHFNYSVAEAFWSALHGRPATRHVIDKGYFALIRNFQRWGWLVSYLFGCSPAVCKTFLREREHDLADYDPGTLHLPYATSLRMSDLGYKNDAQQCLTIDYSGVTNYVNSLGRAIETPHPPYESLGVLVDGEYRQLNSNLLQIENEYYSFVRPKQIARSGEKPTLALRRRGVLYVEIRALDVNAFEPEGVSLEQLHLLEVLLVFCALQASPAVSQEEYACIERTQAQVAKRGRDPDLKVSVDGREDTVSTHARSLLEALRPIAEAIDASHGQRGDETRAFTAAVDAQLVVVNDPRQLPSARMLANMREENIPYFRFAMNQSERFSDQLRAIRLDSDTLRMLETESQRSLELQAEIERRDTLPFDDYLRRYFNQTLDARERMLD